MDTEQKFYYHSNGIVMLPTYNEKENIGIIIKQILELAIPKLKILIVDDNSPDGTGEIVQEYSRKYPEKIIFSPRKGPRGRGFAGVEGFQKALDLKADYIIEMDADLSHQPSDIPRLLAELDQADLIVGSRYIKGGKIIGWNLYRHLNSRLANFLSKIVLNLKGKDITSGFRVFKASLLKQILTHNLFAQSPFIVEEILYYCQKHKAKIIEVPITFIDRQKGESKLSFSILSQWFIDLYKVVKKIYLNKAK